jgi:hypothetical protein
MRRTLCVLASILSIVACVSEPMRRPAAMDPSNPDAPEAPPASLPTAFEAPSAEVPRDSGAADAGRPGSAPSGHDHGTRHGGHP